MRGYFHQLLIFLGGLALLGLAAGAVRSQPAAQPLPIGVLLERGAEGDRATQLAVQQINAAGGLLGPGGERYELQLVYPRNAPTRPEDIPTALEDLRAQGARAILGPGENLLAFPNLEPLARAGVPVLTLATADTLTDLDVTNNIMRMQAAEGFHSRAAADFLTSTLGTQRIAIVQTEVEATEAVIAFETALAERGLAPLVKLQATDAASLAEQLPQLNAANPGCHCLLGRAPEMLSVLDSQQQVGWRGVFYYRDAQAAILSGALPPAQVTGMLGTAGWVYSTPNRLSQQFLAQYVAAYGQIPGTDAAAAYDAIFTLTGQVRLVGPEMPQLYESLRAVQTLNTVQGQLNPGGVYQWRFLAPGGGVPGGAPRQPGPAGGLSG
ncbi:MAG: amino acid ABC transporter substrate-binding protein [Anaerolineae bacterium]|nr:amino acid ABC transporter substrate-binding protein [Anaerolineae bacterium]